MNTVKDYNYLPLNSLKHKQQQQQQEKISTVLFYQVCADSVKAKQSTAEYGRKLCLFALLTLKVVSESRVMWATSVPISRPLCSRLRPDVRIQTSDSIALCPRLLGARV